MPLAALGAPPSQHQPMPPTPVGGRKIKGFGGDGSHGMATLDLAFLAFFLFYRFAFAMQRSTCASLLTWHVFLGCRNDRSCTKRLCKIKKQLCSTTDNNPPFWPQTTTLANNPDNNFGQQPGQQPGPTTTTRATTTRTTSLVTNDITDFSQKQSCC